MIVLLIKHILLQAFKQLFRALIFSKFRIYSSSLMWNSCQSLFRTSDVAFSKNFEKQLPIQCPSLGTIFILRKTSQFATKRFCSLGFFVIMTLSSSSKGITTNYSFILNTAKDLIFASKVNCIFCRHVVQVCYHWKLKYNCRVNTIEFFIL